MKIKGSPTKPTKKYEWGATLPDAEELMPYSVDVPQPAEPIPTLPDIVDIPDEELMEVYQLFTAWANFLGPEVARADFAEESLEIKLDWVGAGYLVEGEKITAARAARDASNEVRDLRHSLSIAKHRRKLLESALKTCERSAAALSRELTRRTEMMRMDRRSTA